MTEIFRSALSYFAPTGAHQENDFVGQIVELGTLRLHVKRVIAEGGFAFVFVAVDQQGREYALKRLLAVDKESSEAIIQEICFLKKLSGHPNIIQFIQAASVGKEESNHGKNEFLLLTELCKGGALIDLLRSRTEPLTCDQVLQVFHQACQAVKHMHAQQPPIIHRDLKIENLLLDSTGNVKLCDFGSATIKTFKPDDFWTSAQRSNLEDELNRHTTPMYRAPEMIDLYQNFPINESLDIWALGCVLYYLCYMVHPFEDSAKLRILNAKYVIPETDNRYPVFHDLIYGMLQIDPSNRPTIKDVIDRLEEIAAARETDLKGPPKLGLSLPKSSGATAPLPNFHREEPIHSQVDKMNIQTARRPDEMNHQSHPAASNVAGGGGGLFGSLKGQAGSLFKNIKDTSSKVMQTVQASMTKTDLDFKYVTTRVAVMSFPADGLVESTYKNPIDEVKAFLDNRHYNHYAVFNLSQRRYRTDKFFNRVSECGWPQTKAATLHSTFLVCKNMIVWLKQDPKNLCVVHCLDGNSNSAYMICAFLIYCRLFDIPERVVQFFCSKRCLRPELDPSQFRYLHYVSRIVNDPSCVVHNKSVMLVSVSVQPVPVFNRSRTGCRPFIEIYVGEDRVLSTSQEYEKMRQYESHEGKVSIPLEATVTGDVTIAMFHARSTFGTKVQGKLTAIKIFQVQFHSGFLQEGTNTIQYTKSELDIFEEESKVPDSFTVTVDISMSTQERPFADSPPAYHKHNPKAAGPKVLFSSKEEMDVVLQQFCAGQRSQRLLKADSGDEISPQSPSLPSAPQESNVVNDLLEQSETTGAGGNFFDSLKWNGQSHPATDVQRPKRDASPAVQQSVTPNLMDEPVARPMNVRSRGGIDAAEAAERAAGIRVGGDRPPPEEVYEEKSTTNLLDWGDSDLSSQPSQQTITTQPAEPDLFGPADPFAAESSAPFNNNQSTKSGDDWFGFNDAAGAQPTQRGTGGKSDDSLWKDWSDIGVNGLAANTNLSAAAGFRHAASANCLTTTQGLPRNPSSPNFGGRTNLSAAPNDPFLDLGGFGGVKAVPTLSTSRPNTPSFGGSQWPAQSTANSSQPQGFLGSSVPPRVTPITPANSGVNLTGMGGGSTPTLSRPNYTRANIESSAAWNSNTFVSAKPKVTQGAFDDILSSQGFASSKSQGPTSLKSMKRETEVQEMTPEAIKIKDWTEGKRRNIRALLCSLHTIVWEENDKWEAINMSQLLTANQVKKFYRKACLAVHPDKVDSPYEALAKAIFTELNDAWNEFENAGEPSLT